MKKAINSLSFIFRLIWASSLLLMASMTASVAGNSATGPHIKVSLLSEYQGVQPGNTQWLGIYLQPETHWHTYWRNPGDSGESPKVTWRVQLSNEQSQADGIEFGDINWPVPHEIPVAHLVNYGYEGANLLIVPVTLPQSIATGQNLNIQAELSWLVCKEDCIPGWATLELSLPVTEQPQPSSDAILFADTMKTWPQSDKVSALFEVTEQNLILNITDKSLGPQWRLLPFRSDVMQHNGEQSYRSLEDSHSFVLAKSDYFPDTFDSLRFLLTDGKTGFEVNASLNSGLNSSLVDMSGESHTDMALPIIMLFAFAGGVILNLMPCVLPVLAIKALSVGNAQQSVTIKLGYLAGVLVSFLGFALLIEVLKSAGEAVGWGFHMQEPLVIMLLCVLFLYLALMLMDIAPGGNSLTGLGQNLVNTKSGGNQFSSQFFTGVLAVVVASPCTAPFMGVALGAAMVSSATNAMLTFLSLGLGFGLPLTLVFFNRRLASLIPKPGAWMETFKQFLAFPMFATLIWLLWVFQGQAGASAQALLMLALLILALFLWALPKAGKFLSGLLATLALVSLVFTAQYGGPASTQSQEGQYVAWSADKMQQLKAQNEVVLVNMTADWCITCKVNEQVAFKTEEFQTLLAKEDLHYLVGDWTNKNQEILSYLNQYDRVGVPLYVIYAGNHYQEVLPQILTPQMLSSAISRARETQQAQEQL